MAVFQVIETGKFDLMTISAIIRLHAPSDNPYLAIPKIQRDAFRAPLG